MKQIYFYNKTLVCDVLYILSLWFGHVSEVGEDNEPGEEACEGVHGRRHQAVPGQQWDLHSGKLNVKNYLLK